MHATTYFNPSEVAYEVRLNIFRNTTKADRDNQLIVRDDVCGNRIHLKDFGRADSVFGWTLVLIDPYGRPCPENFRALSLDDALHKPAEPCWTCANSKLVCDGEKWAALR
jgi:hypothetical protein